MIRRLRLELELSQAVMAEKLEITQGAISHYENGRRSIDVAIADKLIQLAAQYGRNITYNDIFGSQSASTICGVA